MFLNIQENAIFIADTHYNENRVEFLSFLLKVKTQEIKTTQLFLMGDMFDFLCSQGDFFVNKNIEVINLLNELSKSIEIVYLEGNHDYNLKKLFPNIKVYKREKQPILAKLNDKNVSLSHGDIFVNQSYDAYCKIIRNKLLLNIINSIDFNNIITKKIDKYLLSKNICHKLDNFEEIAKKRVENYNTDIIIEGHYHQGSRFEFGNKEYINIPSLACSNEYSIVKNNTITNTSFY
jgi:UDP-2,3-diacylglucosamine hydrolase